MTWQNTYDRVMMCCDGELAIIGGHYTKKQCLKIIEEDNYDDPYDYKDRKLEHVYVKFGLVNYEGELTNGFLIKEDYKKGRIKCTLLKEKKVV